MTGQHLLDGPHTPGVAGDPRVALPLQFRTHTRTAFSVLRSMCRRSGLPSALVPIQTRAS